ncbi:MAG: diacylglycerol kinase family lipid kinase [Lachnospiraceae bacterium]|nr:diacylglycerol kinase family lipid kinase [Lachnospiraceae bacterium]
MFYFLVNPASKSGHGMKVWNKVSAYLNENNVEYEVIYSKRPGHMQELMYDLCSKNLEKEGRINVVILGGDGTFNEAIQGVVSFDKVNIGYIPTGSSNDFARALPYTEDPVENARRIVGCKTPLKYDLGRLKYECELTERSSISTGSMAKTRYFNVSCGIGFDAAVCEEALNSRGKDFLNKFGLGKLAYGLIAIKQIFGAKLCDARLTFEDGETVEIKKCRFVVGMNTCYEGGGYKFCPKAVPDDGYLDICTVGDISPIGVILALPGAMKGNHTKKKKIHLYHVKEYEITTDKPLWVHTDGEVHAKADHIKVSVFPGALNFLF